MPEDMESDPVAQRYTEDGGEMVCQRVDFERNEVC